jgi:predicted ester cyclase
VAAEPYDAGLLLRDAVVPGRRAAAVIQAIQGDRTLGGKLFARNYREHKPWRREGERKELDLREVFPDLDVTVDDAIESGDRVVVRWRVTGTHKGEFKDFAPSGKTVDFTGINIYRFAGGRIVESWGQFDSVTLQQNCQELAPQVLDYVSGLAEIRR